MELFANATNAASYSWSGPNGFTSNAPDPVIANVTANNNGTYTLVATSSIGCETSESIVVNNVASNLATPVVVSSGPVCAGALISLNIQQTYTGTTVTYSWVNATGTEISTSNSLSILSTDANAISPYSVQVMVDGCNSDFSAPTNVFINPSPVTTASNNGPICSGDEVQLFAGTVVNGTYEWVEQSSGTLVSTSQNPIIPNISATTTYELTVTANGCTASSAVSTTVTVSPNPSTAPTATASTICEGATLELFANATNGSTYLWTGPNGFTSNAEDPVIPNATIDNNGTYTVVVTSSIGCEATANVTVSNIIETPTTPTIVTNSPVCIDEDITLLIQQTYTGTTVTYEWVNGGGTSIGTGSTVTIAASDANAISPYRVKVTVDGCISDGSDPATVIVLSLIHI